MIYRFIIVKYIFFLKLCICLSEIKILKNAQRTDPDIFLVLQVRNLISAWCAARRSPRAATWSRTCVSTPATSRFSAACATRRFRERSIYEGTGKVSIRRRRRSIIALFRYRLSSRTTTGARLRYRHIRRIIVWYPCPAAAETRSADRRMSRPWTQRCFKPDNPPHPPRRRGTYRIIASWPIEGNTYCEIGRRRSEISYIDLIRRWSEGVMRFEYEHHHWT